MRMEKAMGRGLATVYAVPWCAFMARAWLEKERRNAEPEQG
jgi:hypothetical protein